MALPGIKTNQSPDESEPGSVAGIQSAVTGVTTELQVEDSDERSEKPG